MMSIVVGAEGFGSIFSRRARFRPRMRSSWSEFRFAYLTIFPSSKTERLGWMIESFTLSVKH